MFKTMGLTLSPSLPCLMNSNKCFFNKTDKTSMKRFSVFPNKTTIIVALIFKRLIQVWCRQHDIDNQTSNIDRHTRKNVVS